MSYVEVLRIPIAYRSLVEWFEWETAMLSLYREYPDSPGTPSWAYPRKE